MDDDADDVIDEGEVVTYTVTFSEDIDAASVTTADFSNAGTAGVTVDSATETGATTGVFTVVVTTTSPGTLRLQVPAGAVITDVVGNALDTTTAILDDTTITARVKKRFAEDPQVAASRISVETLKGTVQLSGFATSEAERQRAAQLARSVPDVRDVRNDVIVRAPTQ